MNDPDTKITVTLSGYTYTFQDGEWTGGVDIGRAVLKAHTPPMNRHSMARDIVDGTLRVLGFGQIMSIDEVEPQDGDGIA